MKLNGKGIIGDAGKRQIHGWVQIENLSWKPELLNLSNSK